MRSPTNCDGSNGSCRPAFARRTFIPSDSRTFARFKPRSTSAAIASSRSHLSSAPVRYGVFSGQGPARRPVLVSRGDELDTLPSNALAHLDVYELDTGSEPRAGRCRGQHESDGPHRPACKDLRRGACPARTHLRRLRQRDERSFRQERRVPLRARRPGRKVRR